MEAGDWIKVPNAEELAGPLFENNKPMRVYKLLENGAVSALGVIWEKDEYEECDSPLFRQEGYNLIVDSKGALVMEVDDSYLHLISLFLNTLNQDLY